MPLIVNNKSDIVQNTCRITLSTKFLYWLPYTDCISHMENLKAKEANIFENSKKEEQDADEEEASE